MVDTKMDYRAQIYAFAGVLQRRITPELRYSQTVFEERLGEYVLNAERWLDLGCGHRLLPEWRGLQESRLVSKVPFVVGVDADFAAIRRHRSIRHRCTGDVARLPFRDASFDLITANMVVEHLSDPEAQFAEVSRVLAPGGTFVFHTPNAQSYVIVIARLIPDGMKRFLAGILEGRDSSDVYPTYYLANDASRISVLAERGGFHAAHIEFVASSPAFSMIPPLLIPELLWIRQLQRRPGLAKYRHTLICALRRAS